MKHCPTCNRTYGTDAPNFCPADGAHLIADPPDASPQSPYQQQRSNQPASFDAQSPHFNQPATPAPAKSRKGLYILGGLGAIGCLGLLALVGGLALLGYFAGRDATDNANRAANADKNSSTRANTRRFVNSRTGLTGDFAKNYVDFSFDYPADWSIKTAANKPDESNFVKVERALDDGDITLENFAVGYMTGGAWAIPMLSGMLDAQLAKGFPNYRKVSEGKTRVNGYNGHQILFTSRIEKTPKGPADIYGRVILLPNDQSQASLNESADEPRFIKAQISENEPGAAKSGGVVLIMLASSFARDIKSVEDVGVKGELPIILDSFRLGASAASNNSSEESNVVNQSDAADKETVLAELVALETEWNGANVRGDKATLRRILADEYKGKLPDGTTETKAQYVAGLKPNPNIKTEEMSDLNLDLSGDTATLRGILNITYKNGAREKYRFTDTFVRRDGRWQAIGAESSLVAAP